MKFVLTFKDAKDYRPRHLLVAAEAAHDVRQWALVRFRDDPHDVELLKKPGPGLPLSHAPPASRSLRPDVTMRWEGSDAGALPNRRLVVVEHLCLLCFGLPRPVDCDACGGDGWKEDGCAAG